MKKFIAVMALAATMVACKEKDKNGQRDDKPNPNTTTGNSSKEAEPKIQEPINSTNQGDTARNVGPGKDKHHVTDSESEAKHR